MLSDLRMSMTKDCFHC